MAKVKKNKLHKPRNLTQMHLINRGGSGAHVKSKKAVRQQDKLKLKKELAYA